VLFFLAVFACFGAAPWDTSQTHLDIADYDQYELFESTVFRQSVIIDSVTDPTTMRAATYVSIPPVVVAPVRTDVQTVYLEYGGYVFYAYNLLQGSAVYIRLNSTSLITICAIEGEAAFEKWQSGGNVKMTYSRTYYYVVGAAGAGRAVYFVFSNAGVGHATGSAVFTVAALVYDTANWPTVDTCVQYPCFLPLAYNTNQIAIIEGLPNNNTANYVRSVNYQVAGRAGPYIAISGGVCLFLILCTIFFCCLARRERLRAQQTAIVVSPTPVTTVDGVPSIVPTVYQTPVYADQKTPLLATPQFVPTPGMPQYDFIRPPSVNPETI